MELRFSTPGRVVTAVAARACAERHAELLVGADSAAELALGACGGILASAHLATAGFARLIRLWHDGVVAAARRLGAAG